MTLPTCPESELLAACAEGHLRGDEREHVLRHLTSCHDCYTVFTEALRFLEETPALESATVEARAVEAVPAADATAEAPARARPAMRPEPALPREAEGTSTTPPAEPGDNVIPFDRRRWRRVAPVALPLAAAAALAVVVMQRTPPAAPPVTVAQAPPTPTVPTPSPPPPATSLVRRADLSEDWPLPRPPMRSAFAGAAARNAQCLYAGVMAVEIEVAGADALLAERLLRRTADVLELRGADAEWSAALRRLADGARAGRLPSSGDLRPAACLAVLLDAGRSVELVRLAAWTRDPALLRHPEVVAGLSTGRAHLPDAQRPAFDELARLAAARPLPEDARAWRRLRNKAEDLASRWP